MSPLDTLSDWIWAASALASAAYALAALLTPHRTANGLDRLAALADAAHLPKLSGRATGLADQISPAEPEPED